MFQGILGTVHAITIVLNRIPSQHDVSIIHLIGKDLKSSNTN